jgi:hypothetical protein
MTVLRKLFNNFRTNTHLLKLTADNKYLDSFNSSQHLRLDDRIQRGMLIVDRWILIWKQGT